MSARIACALLVPCLIGCESVPDISFASDAADDGLAASDAANDAASDVAKNDGGATLTCTDGGGGAPPDGGICCANGWACSGVNCSIANCDYCALHCSTALPLCCTKMGASSPQCKASSDRCP